MFDVDICSLTPNKFSQMLRMFDSVRILSVFGLILLLEHKTCITKKIRYLSTEHPEVTYINPKYITYANMTSWRYGRDDPLYYVNLHIYFVLPFNNNISVDFYFYEFLTNRYKRSFVEMHFKFCDLIHKDPFFGAAMRQGNFLQPCPFPAGDYHMYNMTVPLKEIPFNFPFSKGRIQANLTATNTRELIGYGHIDMEIKEFNLRRRKKEKSSI